MHLKCDNHKIITYITIVFISVSLFILWFQYIFQSSRKREVKLNLPAEAVEATLASFKKINDHPLYFMHYFGDYKLKEFLEVGARNENEMRPILSNMFFNETACLGEPKDAEKACTGFSVLDKQRPILFGHNEDWHHTPIMVLYTKAPGAYASISIVNLEKIHAGAMGSPDDPSVRKFYFQAPYFPMSGMNEHGLAVANYSVERMNFLKDSVKIPLPYLAIQRLILDYAKNIDEAEILIKKYRVAEIFGLQFLIVDREGNSAIVEWIEDKVIILRNSEKWQVATNFLQYHAKPKNFKACWRYQKVKELLTACNGNVDEKKAMDILKQASVARSLSGLNQISDTSTQWSVVYDLTRGYTNLVMARQYGTVLKYRIGPDGVFLSDKSIQQ